MAAEAELEPAVVIDFGSHMIKSGFAGDDVPRCFGEAFVGRMGKSHPLYPRDREVAIPSDYPRYGSRILGYPNYPMKDGLIHDWNDAVRLIDHTFHAELRKPPEESRVLMTERADNTHELRAKLAEHMFETLHVPHFALASHSALTLYACGELDGLSIDIGWKSTRIAPVLQGSALPHRLSVLPVGGDSLVVELQKLLTELGYSFTTTSERYIVQDMVKNKAYVALDSAAELKKFESDASSRHEYELPDGQMVNMTSTRFRCTEVLFRGDDAKEGKSALADVVLDCLNGSDIAAKPRMLTRCAVSGATSLLPGIVPRLQAELESRLPSGTKLKLCNPENHAVWIGGSIIASLSGFEDNFASQADYQEVGKDQVMRRLAF